MMPLQQPADVRVVVPRWILKWCSNKKGVVIFMATWVYCYHSTICGGIWKQQELPISPPFTHHCTDHMPNDTGEWVLAVPCSWEHITRPGALDAEKSRLYIFFDFEIHCTASPRIVWIHAEQSCCQPHLLATLAAAAALRGDAILTKRPTTCYVIDKLALSRRIHIYCEPSAVTCHAY